MGKKRIQGILVTLLLILLVVCAIGAIIYFGYTKDIFNIFPDKVSDTTNPPQQPQVNIQPTIQTGPTEPEVKPCAQPSDCGIDGCIQQGMNKDICNGKRYVCDAGKCVVQDNLFYNQYCTPFGCQDLCGNSACEVQYGETDKNCPGDCLGKGLTFDYR